MAARSETRALCVRFYVLIGVDWHGACTCASFSGLGQLDNDTPLGLAWFGLLCLCRLASGSCTVTASRIPTDGLNSVTPQTNPAAPCCGGCCSTGQNPLMPDNGELHGSASLRHIKKRAPPAAAAATQHCFHAASPMHLSAANQSRECALCGATGGMRRPPAKHSYRKSGALRCCPSFGRSRRPAAAL